MLLRFHFVIAAAIFVLGCTVMLGWITKDISIVQIHPEFAPMMFNTALCFALLSLSILLSESKKPVFSRFLSLSVIFISGLTFLEYLFGINIGVDHFFNEPFLTVGEAISGRMALSTSACFLMLATVLYLRKPNFTSYVATVTVSSLVTGFSVIGVLGYLLGFNSEYGWGSFSRMAIHTSVGFFALAYAIAWQLHAGTDQRTTRKRTLGPFYVITSGVLFSVLIWHLLILRDQESNRNIVRIQAESIKVALDNVFMPLERALQHMARRFSYGGYPNEKIWYHDAEGYFHEFEGLRRLLWVDENHVIKWVYPLDQVSIDLKKLNTASDEEVIEALRKAQKERRAYLSNYIQFRTGGSGFALFVPIFTKGNYRGTVRASFSGKPFFERVFRIPGYHLTIFENGKEVFSTGKADPIFARDWRTKTKYDFLGANWEIALVPSAQTIRENTSGLPNLVLGFGVSISILLGVALRFYHRARESEKTAHEAFEWKQAGMNSVPLLMISLDANILVREMNAAAEKLLEYTTSEIQGQLPFIFHDIREVELFREKLEREIGHSLSLNQDFLNAFYSLGYNRATEWTLVSKSGKKYHVVLSQSKIYDDQGNVTGYLGIYEDVTEKRAREQLLKEQEEKIMASSRLASLGEMAAGIAHEINNPLTIINGHVSVLRRILGQKGLSTDGELAKRMDSIEGVIQRIAKIIRGMKSYVHDSDDSVSELVHVDALIDDTLAFCQEKFRSEGVELVTNIEPQLMVNGRSYQISQVLLNLLNNAVDAVSACHVKKVILEAREKNGGVEVSVCDTGPGVPYHLRAKIMEPFFTTKEVGKGVGLGLSISQGIIQSHGGKFYLDETSSKTRFVVWLPSAPTDSRPNQL